MSLLNPPPNETLADRIQAIWPIAALAGGLIGWMACTSDKHGGRAMLCYPLIALAVTGATVISIRRHRLPWLKWVGIALTVALLYWWGAQDTYDERWWKGNTRFTDTFTRWGDRPVRREVYFFDSDEDAKRQSLLADSARGPLAGTGKPHGRWELTFWKPDYRHETKFYWYGEQISEGEWHLRNK